MTEFNVIAELPLRKHSAEQAGQLVDKLADFHPAIATSPLGWCEVTMTVQGETIGQAVVVASALLGEVVSITAMTTEEFDRRPVGVEQLGELLSATEAAAELGITRQAVQQRLEAGRLPGVKVGPQWVIPRGSLPTRRY